MFTKKQLLKNKTFFYCRKWFQTQESLTSINTGILTEQTFTKIASPHKNMLKIHKENLEWSYLSATASVYLKHTEKEQHSTERKRASGSLTRKCKQKA